MILGTFNIQINVMRPLKDKGTDLIFSKSAQKQKKRKKRKERKLVRHWPTCP
jgi:hypothetical protein